MNMDLATIVIVSTIIPLLTFIVMISCLYAYLKTRSKAVLTMFLAFVSSFVINLLAAFIPPFLVEPKLAFLYAGLVAQFIFTILFIVGVLLLKSEFER